MIDDNKISKEELLKPENMILMYARGAFPMADETGEIDWYYPEERTIIPLDNYNYPRSLRKFMEKSDFEFRYNTNVSEVIKRCSERKETWISDKLISAYNGLIMLGHANSVEVYQKGLLVGGLFGISYMGAFFGESMFSEVSQASKSALIKLIERLNERNYKLLDVQFPTVHLEMFGTREVDLDEFDSLLMQSYTIDTNFI